MTIPERARPQRLGDYLAIVTRAIFQAGLSWKAIDAQWDAFRRLFDDFDPVLVAAYGEGDIERILADGGIVRSRKKIAATIANARTLLEIERTTTMAAYLRSFASYAELARDLRARFAFLGELSAYYLVFRVGEPVPRFEDWETTIAGDHPRMREMVAHARARGYDETVRLTAEDEHVAATGTKKTTEKKAKKSEAKTPRTYAPEAGEKVAEAMDEMKAGRLRSGRVAIGLGEARREGVNVPPPPAKKKRS